MSAAQFTPGPWDAHPLPDDLDFDFEVNRADGLAVAGIYRWSLGTSEANAHLIKAAPDLYDGCNAMLGLAQLLLGRDDLPAEVREALTTSHRIRGAEAAVAKARGEQ